MQWEDAADEEDDWETAEAAVPIAVSGVTGSFDVDATEEAGQPLLDHVLCLTG